MRNQDNVMGERILNGIRPFFHCITFIKPLVYKGVTKSGLPIFIKGALKEISLIKQIQFSITHPSSFVTFIPFDDGDWMKQCNGYYWACMVAEEGRNLDYSLLEERRLAVEKLGQFHAEAAGLAIEGLNRISLKKKWMERLMRFENSVSTYRCDPTEIELVKSFIQISYKVLTEMDDQLEALELNAFKQRYIVHGDPAHHNFIFNRTNLLMIDGDLISYAPLEYDFLQLMNRMLPFSNWSLEEWYTYRIPAVKNILNDSSLLQLLAYPTDFYREWLVNPEGRDELLWRTKLQNDVRYPFMVSLLK